MVNDDMHVRLSDGAGEANGVELLDEDLDQVVGGLNRVWVSHVTDGATIAKPVAGASLLAAQFVTPVVAGG